LIQSELAGLAFDSLQQGMCNVGSDNEHALTTPTVFRKVDIAIMFDTAPLPPVKDQMIWYVI